MQRLAVAAGLGRFHQDGLAARERAVRAEVLCRPGARRRAAPRRCGGRGPTISPTARNDSGRIVRRFALSSSVRSSMFVAAFCQAASAKPGSRRASESMRSLHDGIAFEGHRGTADLLAPEGFEHLAEAGRRQDRARRREFRERRGDAGEREQDHVVDIARVGLRADAARPRGRRRRAPRVPDRTACARFRAAGDGTTRRCRRRRGSPWRPAARRRRATRRRRARRSCA